MRVRMYDFKLYTHVMKEAAAAKLQRKTLQYRHDFQGSKLNYLLRTKMCTEKTGKGKCFVS
jgi:hypothetical protein